MVETNEVDNGLDRRFGKTVVSAVVMVLSFILPGFRTIGFLNALLAALVIVGIG